MSADVERRNPFVGLRPFFDEDAFYFFGRGEQTTDLLQLLHEHRFVPVLGSSGSGKSSLVRAGLIPMLQGGFMVSERDGWRMTKCRPGEAPLENLAEALQYAMGEGRRPASAALLAQRMREEHTDAIIEYVRPRLKGTENLFILVDQFEELFAFRSAAGGDGDDELGTTPDAERIAERIRRRQDASSLVSLLLALSRQKELPVYVSITMRTDFLGDCDLFEGLPEAINASGYLVPRLTRKQLRECVVGPARLHGAQVAPRLVDRVLNDVGDRGDQLPVLQHALLRTWERWEAGGRVGPLDLMHFEQAGGLDGALAQQADEITASADPIMVERIFKRLTTTDTRRRRVRSPARLSELITVSGAPPDAVKALLARCVAEGVNFLYAAPDGKPGDPRYDIVHESLIRQWPTLRAWVDEERDLRDWWVEMGKRAHADAVSAGDDLLTPRALQLADERLAKHPVSEAWAERYAGPGASYAATMGYIERSRHAIEQRRREAEQRRQSRRKWAMAGVGTCVLLGLVAAVFAWRATTALRKADTLSRDFAIEQLTERDPTYATALAAEFTADRYHSLDRLGLVQNVLGAPVAAAEFGGASIMALDGTGTTIALGFGDGHLELRPADGRGAGMYVQIDSFTINALQFSRDGRSLLAGSAAGAVHRLSIDDLSTLETWTVPSLAREGLRESPDGRSVATVDGAGNLRISTASAGDTVTKAQNVTLVEFDPRRAGHVYAVTRGGALLSVDATRPGAARISTLDTVGGQDPGVLLVSPSGDAIVTGGFYLPTRVFRPASRAARDVAGAMATSAAISPDGTRLVLGSIDGDVAMYDLGTLDTVWTIKAAHDEPLLGVAFADSGRAVISASYDRSVRWTPVEHAPQSARLLGHQTDLTALRTAAVGGRAATLDLNGIVRVWTRPEDWGQVVPSVGHGPVRSVALSGNGAVVITAFDSGHVIAQFPRDTRPPLRMAWPGAAPVAELVVALTTSGDRALIVPYADAGAYLWTVGTAPAVPILQTPAHVLTRGMFSADGTTLLLEHLDGTVLRADGRTGAPRDTIVSCDATDAVMELSRNGQVVAVRCAGTDDVHITTPQGRWTLPASEISPVQVLRLSADGRTLFVGGAGPFSQLVETSGQRRQRLVRSRQSQIISAAISGNGTRLMTGAADKSVEFTSLPVGEDTFAALSDIVPDMLIEAHRFQTVHVAFSDDDSMAVSTGADGGVRVYRIGLGYPNVMFQHPEPLPFSPYLVVATSALSRSARMLTSVALLSEGDVPGRTPRIIARYHRWDLDPARLVQRLQERTSVCVPAANRLLLIATEERSQADERALACERRQGRDP